MRRAYLLACAVLMGTSFAGGLVWSICAITITRDQTHVVAGVGLIGGSAVAGVWASMAYALWGPRETAVVTVEVRPRRDAIEVTTLVLREGAVVGVATSATSPPKIVVFEPAASTE
jgi:hypothetical protein